MNHLKIQLTTKHLTSLNRFVGGEKTG